jgi:hypothetical protein
VEGLRVVRAARETLSRLLQDFVCEHRHTRNWVDDSDAHRGYQHCTTCVDCGKELPFRRLP